MPDSSVNPRHLGYGHRILVACAAGVLGISLLALLAVWLRGLPAFGYAMGVLALVFGAYAAGYAIYHDPGPEGHFFNVATSVISTTAGLVLLTVTVIQPDIHPLVFAIPTLLSLVVIVWLFGPLQREAWEEIKEETEALGADELSGAIEEQEEDEDDIQEKVMRLGWMTGQALWLACIPLAIVWAFSNSREVMPVLLALPSDQPSSVPSNFARLLNFGDPAIALAWGSLLGIIGAMGLALVLMFRARPSEIPEFVVDANGLVLGYGITIGVMWLSGSNISTQWMTMIGFTFAYVILLHYGIKALGFLIPQRGFRGKYESLLAGVEGLGAGWLLSIALGNSAAVFSGFVFIASVFVATSVVERLGWRWLNPAVRVIRLSQPAELVASAKASPRWFGVWIVAGVVVYPLVGVFLVAPLLREALRLPSP